MLSFRILTKTEDQTHFALTGQPGNMETLNKVFNVKT